VRRAGASTSRIFFLQFYRGKFEDQVLQRSLPVREFQLTVGHGVSLSQNAGEMHGAASVVRLDDQLSSGLLVEEEVLARGTRGDLPDLLLGVFNSGCRAKPEHSAVFYFENIERRTCHLYPRFSSFTTATLSNGRLQLFLPGKLRAFRCLFPSQLVGKDLLGDGQWNLREMYFGPEHCTPPSNTSTLAGLQ
jgi:hypothetical protein